MAELGVFAEGVPSGEEGVRIAEAVAHPGSLMWAYAGSVYLYLRQGDLPGPSPCSNGPWASARTRHIPILFPTDGRGLGCGVCPVRARRRGRAAARAGAGTRGNGMAASGALSLALGEAHLLAGRLEEAHALAERALALARATPGTWPRGVCPAAPRRIAAQRDPPEVEPAEAHYRQALALAEELGMRPLQAHCHLGLGTLYAKTGQPEQARAELSAAIELYRAMDMTFWLPQAEAALAQVEGR